MSEKKNVQALRQAAIDYMREMSQIKWTASEDIDLTVIKNTLFYKKGETYYGVIYNTNKGVDGETFASYIDENGIFRGPVAKKECPGNHCTSTILITWRKLGDKNKANWSVDMMPQCGTGILSVGKYEWRKEDKTTIEMVDRTPEQDLYEDYALMQCGDAILYCFGPTGHARMIKDNVVVRNPDGTINPDESYITSIEQTSSFDKNAPVNTTWFVDHKYYYQRIREKKYGPITIQLFQEEE